VTDIGFGVLLPGLYGMVGCDLEVFLFVLVPVVTGDVAQIHPAARDILSCVVLKVIGIILRSTGCVPSVYAFARVPLPKVEQLLLLKVD
jgi:hypothetical protein